MKFKTRKVKFIWNKKLEGKNGYVANNINELKDIVEGKCCADFTIVQQSEHDALPFKDDIGMEYRFFYPIQEPAKPDEEMEDYEEGFKDDAEFGYNKANEWNYPSKGEYPKENKQYLCKIKAFIGRGIRYECFDYDTKYGSWKDASGDVIAWKEVE